MKLHRKIAHLLGYELIRRQSGHLNLHDHLHHLFNTYGVNLVLDVGANVGQFAKALRAAGYAGHIASFEPVSISFSQLQQASQADPHWQAYPFALGKEEATKTIHVPQDTSLASFLNTNAYFNERYTEKGKLRAHENVQVRRLDSVIGEICSGIGNPRIYLKLDTQGCDLEVMQGAVGSLGRIVAMQSEISLAALYEGMPDYLSSLRYYQALGFEITGLYPVSRDRATLRIVELDCVMVHVPHVK
jgi:FkbM family methyltransferase